MHRDPQDTSQPWSELATEPNYNMHALCNDPLINQAEHRSCSSGFAPHSSYPGRGTMGCCGTPFPSSTHGDTDTQGLDSIPLLLIQSISFRHPNHIALVLHLFFQVKSEYLIKKLM